MADEFKPLYDNNVPVPPARIIWPYLFAPDVGKQYSTKGWRVDFMWPKADFKERCAEIRERARALARESWPDLDTKKITWPWKDGDKKAEKYAFMAGQVTMRAKRKTHVGRPPRENSSPLVVDPLREPLTRAQIKGGDVCAAIISLFTYENSEKVVRENGEEFTRPIYGVSCTLEVVQKRANGEPLGGTGGGPDVSLLDKIEGGFEEDLIEEKNDKVADPGEVNEELNDDDWN